MKYFAYLPHSYGYNQLIAPPPSLAAEDALAQAHSAYSTVNPTSHDAFVSSCKNLPGGNTSTVLHANLFPMTFASGNGRTVTSLDINTYIDVLGEFTAGIYGHNGSAIQVPSLYEVDGARAGLQPPGTSLTWNGDRHIEFEFYFLGSFGTILWSVKDCTALYQYGGIGPRRVCFPDRSTHLQK